MLKTETYQGPIEVRTILHEMKVYNDPEGGGSVSFYAMEVCYKDGVPFGVGDMRQYKANFADFPPGTTFPVVINGNTVQVSGATILAALDAVAKYVVEHAP